MQKEHCQTVKLGKYDLFPQQFLGKGATGIVYKGEETSSKKAVAIKHIDLATIRDDATKSLLQNQIKALKMLSHPNILQFYDIVQNSGSLYIVTELLEGGTLKDFLAKKGPLGQMEAMTLFKSILAGCLSVIDGGVIHRDLKPGNIMLHNGSPKIIDFGFCEVIIGGGIVRAFNVGSPAYMAPEALLKTLYSQKSDSWSLGVILFQMLHGQTPDRGMDTKQFLENVRLNPSLIKESINQNLSKNTKEIIQKSLAYKQEDRMSINGMKYLADVFMLSKNKTSPISHSSHMEKSPQSYLSPINMASPNIPLRQSIKKGDAEKIRNKFTSSIMYTQLPGKKLKQNSQKMAPSSSQLLLTPNSTQPNHPNIRMQPFSYSKVSQPQTPNGFISFSEFVRPPSMLSTQNRNGLKISEKGSSVTKDSNEAAISMKDIFGQKINWQNVSSNKQIMDRPPGKPVFRQVTVRYI